MKTIFRICAIFTAIFAQNFDFRPGESQLFTFEGTIGTVFASDPNVLDYKIINANTLAIYAKANGYAEIKVLSGRGGVLLLDARGMVDDSAANFAKIVRIIEEQNPGSSVKIEMLSPNSPLFAGQKGYMISGTVPSEEARDRAYKTAAAALGLSTQKGDVPKKGDTPKTSGQGVDTTGNSSTSGEKLDFIAKVQSDALVDALKVQAQNQVNVKLFIADVERTIIKKLGIEFNNGVFNLPIQIGKVGGNASQPIIISALIEAVNDDRFAKILATPNISVLSGQSASFQVLSQFTPITNNVQPNGNIISSLSSAVDYGVSLTVQPRVFSKNKIVLNISQEVSNIQSLVNTNGASGANLKKRRTSNVIELKDGDSFILGGLIDERDVTESRGIPFLSDIPYLGRVFTRNSTTRHQSELIIVATVSLTKPISPPDPKTAEPSVFVKNLIDFALTKNDPYVRALLQNAGFAR